jgi:hypothetical protein
MAAVSPVPFAAPNELGLDRLGTVQAGDTVTGEVPMRYLLA